MVDRRAEDDDKGVVLVRKAGAKAEAPPNRATDRARPAIFILLLSLVARGYWLLATRSVAVNNGSR